MEARPTRSRRKQIGRQALGWCIWLVIILVGNLHAELVDRVVAVVNNDVILLSDLNLTLVKIKANLDKQGYSDSQKNQILKQQRSRVIEQLIYDKLTDQQIKRLNLKINENEVDATIKRIEKINKISEEALRQNLEQDGIAYDDYRKEIKDKILRARLVNREVKSRIVITDQDVKNYYDSHREEYGGNTKFELRHILIKVSPSADASEKERARRKVDDIYKQLQNGSAFARLAAEHSEAASASNDGRLGVFDLNILSENIRQALKGLKTGEFSAIVDSDQGYQIFYVERLIQSGGKKLDEVRAEIQEKLYAEIVDKKFNEWIKDLRQRSHIQIIEK